MNHYHGFSPLYFGYFVAVCTCYICNSLVSAFIYSSFSATMSSTMPYFTGSTTDHLIATSCQRLDSCYTLCCINPKVLHTLCILIVLHHPSEKIYLSISQKEYLKTPHVVLKLQLISLVHPVNIPGGQKWLML